MIPSVARRRLRLLSEFESLAAYLQAFRDEPCCRDGAHCANCMMVVPTGRTFCSVACREALDLQWRILGLGASKR